MIACCEARDGLAVHRGLRVLLAVITNGHPAYARAGGGYIADYRGSGIRRQWCVGGRGGLERVQGSGEFRKLGSGLKPTISPIP